MHDHGSHSHGLKEEGFSNKKRFGFVIFFNIIITIAEYIGGVLSGSLALISDAGHNLSDVLSLILGYAGERVSEIKPDRRFSFGLKRFEVLIALVNAMSLLLIGIYIVYEAVYRYLNPMEINPAIMVPVAFIGLLGNVLSIIIINRNKNSNLNMRAAFLHLLYDAISSIAVIITGIVLFFSKLVILDLVISIIIVFMIVWSSLDVLKESLRIFLQGTPKGIDADEVYRAILAIDGVRTVHGLHIWSVSSTEIFLSCHICIDGDPENINTDTIIRGVNSMLELTFGISHTTLQIENTELCTIGNDLCCR
jgi:cobalt-zinc-cadmium efflux system protein